MKKYLLACGVFLLTLMSLSADEYLPEFKDTICGVNCDQSFYYFKAGVAKTPGNFHSAVPEIGIGSRCIRDNHGFDLSLNLSSLICYNYVSLKGLYLYYPQPERCNRLYFGAGPSLAYQTSTRHRCCGTRTVRDNGSLNFEGVVGMEFPWDEYVMFTQLEFTQPLVYVGAHRNYVPGIAVTGGIGF